MRVVEQRAGRYGVSLRLPVDGLYAAEETQIEFRVVDHDDIDPLQGPTPVIRAQVVATISMPSMPGMPQFEERSHPEALPGEYGVHPAFAHGGDYLLRIAIAPPQGAAFAVEFPLKVSDASSTGRKRTPPPFEFEVRSRPKRPKAGEPADIELVVRSRQNRKAYHSDFEVIHEKLMHLIVVSSDLATFAHEHPVLDSSGIFRIRHVFPSGGTYHLFADVAPRGAGSQVLMAKVEAQGKAAAGVQVDRLPPSVLSRQGATEMRMKLPATLIPVRRTISLAIALRDVNRGTAVTDLDRYLGALGHMILIHHDATTYVHAHADESLPPSQGEIGFLVRFPKPGVYRAWTQFQRGGEVLTGSFVLHASGEPNRAPQWDLAFQPCC